MSCCGRKNSKFYDRPNLGQNCCGYQSVNSCCSNNHSNNGCCDSTNSNTSSSNTCRNYMTTAKSTNNCYSSNSYNNSYGSNSYNNSCCNNVGYDGLSCPFHNNNDCLKILVKTPGTINSCHALHPKCKPFVTQPLSDSCSLILSSPQGSFLSSLTPSVTFSWCLRYSLCILSEGK